MSPYRRPTLSSILVSVRSSAPWKVKVTLPSWTSRLSGWDRRTPVTDRYWAFTSISSMPLANSINSETSKWIKNIMSKIHNSIRQYEWFYLRNICFCKGLSKPTFYTIHLVQLGWVYQMKEPNIVFNSPPPPKKKSYQFYLP